MTARQSRYDCDLSHLPCSFNHEYGEEDCEWAGSEADLCSQRLAHNFRCIRYLSLNWRVLVGFHSPSLPVLPLSQLEFFNSYRTNGSSNMTLRKPENKQPERCVIFLLYAWSGAGS